MTIDTRLFPLQWKGRIAVLLTLVSLAACASTPQKLAANRAAKNMAKTLYASLPELKGARGDGRARALLQASRDGGLHHDVLVALQKRVPSLSFVATDTESDAMINIAARQLGDIYKQGSELDQLGNLHKAEIFITTEYRTDEDGQVDIFLHPHQIATQTSLGIAEGSSYGGFERTAKWSSFGVRCIAVPFVGLYDVGRTSVKWAFRGEKEPTFLGAMGRGLMAVVYSPVALFTSEYDYTKELFDGEDSDAGREQARG